jgi:hypothetical protein
MAKKFTDEQMAAMTADREEIDILSPDSCPKPLKRFYTEEMRAEIAKRVSSGEIRTKRKYVKLGAKASGTKRLSFGRSNTTSRSSLRALLLWQVEE